MHSETRVSVVGSSQGNLHKLGWHSHYTRQLVRLHTQFRRHPHDTPVCVSNTGKANAAADPIRIYLTKTLQSGSLRAPHPAEGGRDYFSRTLGAGGGICEDSARKGTGRGAGEAEGGRGGESRGGVGDRGTAPALPPPVSPRESSVAAAAAAAAASILPVRFQEHFQVRPGWPAGRTQRSASRAQPRSPSLLSPSPASRADLGPHTWAGDVGLLGRTRRWGWKRTPGSVPASGGATRGPRPSHVLRFLFGPEFAFVLCRRPQGGFAWEDRSRAGLPGEPASPP
ncbi:hypothetical protein P7K49_003036 [Saguinus oedipus]|uniref:Uncharacterized protein n=1 Tax=Saguinus oedipus TaxID=9490 RepID=A0ABQ9WJJ1_SAGOE|nr:hypothetical protein P7K49_003036 [Saguinus oedipus]